MIKQQDQDLLCSMTLMETLFLLISIVNSIFFIEVII
jgi:hypothetical protein